jgi:hypothetical protein
LKWFAFLNTNFPHRNFIRTTSSTDMPRVGGCRD